MAVPTIFTLAEDALAQCASRFQGSFLRFGRESASDDRARARARGVVGDRVGSVARARPRHRRNNGGAALRRKPDRHS